MSFVHPKIWEKCIDNRNGNLKCRNMSHILLTVRVGTRDGGRGTRDVVRGTWVEGGGTRDGGQGTLTRDKGRGTRDRPEGTVRSSAPS